MYIPRKNQGQSLVEFALAVILVAMVCITILYLLGISISDLYCRTLKLVNADVETCQIHLLWLENFDNLDDWNFTIGGGWEHENGQLCVQQGGEHRGFTGDEDWDNYTVNVDVAELYQGNGYGVYFRVTEEPDINGYAFQYDPGYRGGRYSNGAFIIRKVVNGQETAPIAAEPAPEDFQWTDVTRQVSVDVEDDTFTAYVDGEEVLQTTDDQFPTGRVGLRSWDGSRSCFDDLSVTQQ